MSIITKEPFAVNSIQRNRPNTFNGELNQGSVILTAENQVDALKNNISTDVILHLSAPIINDQSSAVTVPVSAYVHPSLIMATPSVGPEKIATKASAPKDSFDLDWCDSEDLLRYQHMFEHSQRHLLDLMVRKEEIEGDFFDQRYYSNAYPIIAANPKFAQRYVCCGRPAPGQILIRCDKYMWCSHCAKQKAQKSLSTYQSSFHKGIFHFLTVSFKGGIPFDPTSYNEVLLYWDAIDAALNQMQKQDCWSGIYWVNELSILQFLPLRVLPHAHAIVHADTITDEHIKYLNELLAAHTDDDDFQITLTPSIQHRQIRSEADFQGSISYLTKAIDLSFPYTSAWIQARENDQTLIPTLNRQMREILEGLPVVAANKDRTHRTGSLSARCKSFIGVKPKDREKWKNKTFHVCTDEEAKLFLKPDIEVSQGD